MKRLLTFWDSIQKLTFITEDQRVFDVETATEDVERRLIICQQSKDLDNILYKKI